MNNRIPVEIFLGLLLCVVAFFSSTTVFATTIPDPTEQLRPLVEQIVTILIDPDLQGEDNCLVRREKVMAAAQERFDFDEMSKRVLGRQWSKLSPEEKKVFVTLFTTLLEHAYIGKVEDYSKQKVEFKDQRIKKNKAQVNTVLVDGEVVIPVSYIMILKGQEWMVYDIVVEGVSLVRNYMEQFKEVLRKDGYATLLQQLKDKVGELEAAAKPCPTGIPVEES